MHNAFHIFHSLILPSSTYAGVFAATFMASSAFSAPLTLYLIDRYNMKPNAATNVNNVFSGTYNFSPVVGAFVADALWGRFRTLLFATAVGVVVSFCIILFLQNVVPSLISNNMQHSFQKKKQYATLFSN